MNKSYFACALLLLILIISPSCDSKPKQAANENTEAKSVSANQTTSGEAPGEESPNEQPSSEEMPTGESATEEAPSEESPAEEASAEMEQTEPASTDESSSEADSPEVTLLKAKLDYLKILHKSMGNALEQMKMKKVSDVAMEIHKVASEENSDQQVGVSQPSEMTEEQTPVSPNAINSAEPTVGGSSSETAENLEENKMDKPSLESELKIDENASVGKDNEINQPAKLNIRADVMPKISSKKEDYYVNEEISLKIKVANLSLKDETGPITLHYFIFGKGTKNNNEFVLFNSGEAQFELGKTHQNRSFEYLSSTFSNKYWSYGGPGFFKYDGWFVAIVDRDGKLIQSKSSKQAFKDYDLIKKMEKNFRYDKSFRKLEGARTYIYH